MQIGPQRLTDDRQEGSGAGVLPSFPPMDRSGMQIPKRSILGYPHIHAQEKSLNPKSISERTTKKKKS
jgi:hypothetical protein